MSRRGMMWVGLEAETYRMQREWAGLHGDAAAMADYVYDRMANYTGPDHPAVCTTLIQRLVGIVTGKPPDWSPGDSGPFNLGGS